MNIVRKFLGSSGGSVDLDAGHNLSQEERDQREAAESNVGTTSRNPPKQPDHLSLTHLKKLYSEYVRPSTHPLTEAEKEQALYNILPLFCKVFDDETASRPISELFSEASAFAQAISRLMVSFFRKCNLHRTYSCA